MLNAFRHQRFFHSVASAKKARPVPGAQRLSASKVLSHITGVERVALSLCSTPFGIKGSFTLRAPFIYPLPALCAQRLSASKVLSPARAPSAAKPFVSCAQRLSASKVLSHSRRDHDKFS